MKLDLGCGRHIRDGFEGVDISILPGTKWEVNLLKFPWPWDTSSVEELNCSHFIEHIPMMTVPPHFSSPHSEKDLLCAFIDECHRILKPGGTLTLRWPDYRSRHAFMDPTHRRFIPPETLLYFQKAWREANGLSHYRIDSDWEQVAPLQSVIESNDVEDAKDQVEFGTHCWNVVIENIATLRAVK